MSKLMGPFTPFLAEYMYQILRKLLPKSSSISEEDLSVHFQMMPISKYIFFLISIKYIIREKINKQTNFFDLFFFKIISRANLMNNEIEKAVASVQTVIGLGRFLREKKTVPMKVNKNSLKKKSI